MILYEMLEKLGTGVHRCKRVWPFNNGWISISEDEKGDLNAMWCSHRTYHQRGFGWGPAFSVTVNPKEIVFVCKTIIWMYAVDNEEEARQLHDRMVGLVEKMV